MTSSLFKQAKGKVTFQPIDHLMKTKHFLKVFFQQFLVNKAEL